VLLDCATQPAPVVVFLQELKILLRLQTSLSWNTAKKLKPSVSVVDVSLVLHCRQLLYIHFYRATRMHSAVFAVFVCPPV